MRFKLGLLAMVSMLGIGYGATVAAQPEPGVQSADLRDDRDDGVELGWLGLAGLTGLLGLKRSEPRHRAAAGDLSSSHVSR